MYPHEIATKILEKANNKDLESIQDVQIVLAEIMKNYNSLPQNVLGGLTPDQMRNLANSNWNDSSEAIQLNNKLALKDLNNAVYFCNARILLAAFNEEKKIKATSAGNLNRHFVNQMRETMVFDEDCVDHLQKKGKVINENQVKYLHYLRILCEIGEYIRKEGNFFYITEKGRELLPENQAGTLFKNLFIIHFRYLNLAFLDSMPQNKILQETIAFSLYMVKNHLQQWQFPKNVVKEILLKAAYEEAIINGNNRHPRLQLLTRILNPLKRFGLIESREKSNNALSEYKITDLFTQFIQFQL